MRRVKRPGPAHVTVGWVEVWSNSAAELTCERVAIQRPQFTARWEDGHYRIRERKPLTLPKESIA